MDSELLTLQNIGIVLGVIFAIYVFLRKEGEFRQRFDQFYRRRNIAGCIDVSCC